MPERSACRSVNLLSALRQNGQAPALELLETHKQRSGQVLPVTQAFCRVGVDLGRANVVIARVGLETRKQLRVLSVGFTGFDRAVMYSGVRNLNTLECVRFISGYVLGTC